MREPQIEVLHLSTLSWTPVEMQTAFRSLVDCFGVALAERAVKALEANQVVETKLGYLRINPEYFNR